MHYLLEGVYAGLFLALLVGPLVILLLQLSIRRGTGVALAAAAGIWASDLLFILITHYGIGSIDNLRVEGLWGNWLNAIGGILLLGTAFVLWFRNPPNLAAKKDKFNSKGLFSGALQGFALNTFNPFTLGFWSLFTLHQVHERELAEPDAWAIYAGILGAIVITDSIKVLAARRLRNWLRPEVLLFIQRAGALVIGGFGLVLGYRLVC